MNKKRIIAIIIGLLIIITAMVVLIVSKNKAPDNPPETVGNTPSNLYNGGTFCQYGDLVFFANSNDGDALYLMNKDESGAKKLNSSSVLSINADKDRVYYSLSGKSSGTGLGYVRKSAGLYSCNHRGNDSLCYTFNPVAKASLCGNKLFYLNYEKQSGTSLYAISIDKKNNHQVDNAMINPSCVKDGYIYYNGVKNDHLMYALNGSNESSTVLVETDMYMPVYHDDGMVYYLDPTDDYSLCVINPQSGEKTLLSSERLDFFNIYGNVIYYQVSVGKTPALHKINSDGSNDSIVASGVYTDIQTTSEYLYFRPFDEEGITYHMSHSGGAVEAFVP